MLATVGDKIKDAEGKFDPAIANIYLMKEIGTYLKRKETYNENKTKMFNIIIGQCTELMMSKLESETKWTAIEVAANDKRHCIQI
eukprot:14586644-Ditylum_brightwellii.AAC.1